MGIKISKSQALDLVSAEDGFNNRHVALEKENDLVHSLVCANQHLKKFPLSKKIPIDIEDKNLEEQLALLQMESLSWRVCDQNKPFMNFYLESPVFSLYLGGVHSVSSTREINSTSSLNKDDHSLLIAGLLLYPLTHKSIKFLNPESFYKIKNIISDHVILNCDLEKYKGLESEYLDLSEFSNKKLYNFITKEAKTQSYRVIVESVLEDMDISPDKRKEFFDHVIKYQSDHLHILGSCPFCGSGCGDHLYSKSYKDQWFTCQETGSDFEGSEVDKQSYYFPMNK